MNMINDVRCDFIQLYEESYRKMYNLYRNLDRSEKISLDYQQDARFSDGFFVFI